MATRAHLIGYVPQLAVWTAVGVQFARSARALDGGETPSAVGAMPDWVNAILAVESVLFCSFAAVQALQLTAWRREPHVIGEIAYVVLSFASKASLAFIVFGGTLHLQSNGA